jgi:2-(1,2-epoxy-1,2-dihydrophenyl)acetyl-CoA isomerase
VSARERGGQPGDPVGYAVADGVAVIRLRRPAFANTIDQRLAAGLRASAVACAADPAVRAVLIGADGPRFCAGGDIRVLAAAPPAELPALLDGIVADFHAAIGVLDGLAVPVVCAVRGAVAGGGLALPLVADIVVAADDAVFAAGYPGIGLSPDGGSSWLLPRIAGPRAAARLLLANEPIGAAEAVRAGLVTETVPAADVEARATALARRLAAGPAAALAATRRLLRQAWDSQLAEQLAAERQQITRVAATADAAEGIAAFAARRSPSFGPATGPGGPP